jgi:large subunit ribosomal protein L15
MAVTMLLRPPKGATKNRKRVGRGQGSGLGTTAGRGNNGQKSRSGGSGGPYLGFEGGQVPLYRRLATRGFSNARYAVNYIAINIGQLEKLFNDGEQVNLDSLCQKGLIKASERLVKLLASGTLSKKFEVSGIKTSASARTKIEQAGGKVIAIAGKE